MNCSVSNSSMISQNNISYNKTNINSSNISKFSTMINHSESYLLNNIFENLKTINFQKENIKLKNKFLNVITKKLDRDRYSYKNLFFQNKANNSRKINILKKKPDIKINVLSKNNSDININYKSYLATRIQNEILDDKKQTLLNFQLKIESIIKLKKFLYEHKKLLEKEKENNKNNEILLKKIDHKINNLKYILKENENILEINRYIKFLIEKRIEMKYDNLLLSTKIDYLKDDNKELLIKIKEKSETLWKLYDIRNLLVCIKEKILIKDLPLIFHFCNSSYLSVLIKKYYNYVDLLESRKKYILNNPLIKFKMPTNLVEYIYFNRKSEIEKENFDQKLLKYLNPKFSIFQDEDEFIDAMSGIEKHTIDYYLTYCIYQKHKSDLSKRNNIMKINIIKNENKELLDSISLCNKILFKLKKRNIYLSNYLEDIKKEYNLKYKEELKNVKNKKEKELNQQKINNIFLNSIINTVSPEKNKFYYFLNNLKIEKKFTVNNAYTFCLIARNSLELYNNLPKYFYQQKHFSLEEFDKSINNINNLNHYPLNVIIENAIYLLNLYETAIYFFLRDYKNNKNKDNEIILDIKKEITINKKINLVEFSKVLNNKINKIKEEKLFKKNKKMVIKEKKMILPNINFINNKTRTQRKESNETKRSFNPYSSFIFY